MPSWVQKTARSILYIAVLMSGCTSRTSHLPPPVPNPAINDYIDIRAGWRLTVVTPITKSGDHIVQLNQQTHDNATTLSAEPDFVGYEVAHYAVEDQKGGRVRVEFSSAQVTREGKAESQARPIVPLFQTAHRAKFVRLIYLVRVSTADHNMAVVAASQLDALNAITRQVQTNPVDGCTESQHASCSWIPEGIAVRPEVLRTLDGVNNWIDAPR